MAKLFFRYGAMNSGKTTALLQVAHNYEERGMSVLLLKPDSDTKADTQVLSRLGITRTADLLVSPDINLYDYVTQWHKDVQKISCVLIDEAQFLSSAHVDQLFNITVYQNIPVICYGIRVDFRTQLFPGSQRLFALAHSIEELKTICRCGKKATMNARKMNERFIFDGDQIAIDGEAEVSYESLCGHCYLSEVDKNHEASSK